MLIGKNGNDFPNISQEFCSEVDNFAWKLGNRDNATSAYMANLGDITDAPITSSELKLLRSIIEKDVDEIGLISPIAELIAKFTNSVNRVFVSVLGNGTLDFCPSGISKQLYRFGSTHFRITFEYAIGGRSRECLTDKVRGIIGDELSHFESFEAYLDPEVRASIIFGSAGLRIHEDSFAELPCLALKPSKTIMSSGNMSTGIESNGDFQLADRYMPKTNTPTIVYPGRLPENENVRITFLDDKLQVREESLEDYRFYYRRKIDLENVLAGVYNEIVDNEKTPTTWDIKNMVKDIAYWIQNVADYNLDKEEVDRAMSIVNTWREYKRYEKVVEECVYPIAWRVARRPVVVSVPYNSK